MSRLVNFALYQTGWFACVLGTAWGYTWLGISVACCLMGFHFWLAADRVLQIKLSLTTAAFGFIIDTGQLWGNVFAFPQGSVVDWLPPPFMVVLWMQFATTFRYCLSWLIGRYLLCACFGLIGAPLAFLAGEKLGAIQFLPPRQISVAILALVWSASMPLLFLLTSRWAARLGVAPGYRWRRLGR